MWYASRMSFKIHLVDTSTGVSLYDGLLVDVVPDHVVHPTGAVYRVARTLAPVTTAGGSTVRVYCEPSDPPPPH